MSAGSFEKNNWGWQLNQLQVRVGEWLELKIGQSFFEIPLSPERDYLLLERIAQAFFCLVFALLLAWGIWNIRQLLNRYLFALRNRWKHSAEDVTKTPTSELSVTRWLEQAQILQQQGNYREACFCLYRAMLQRLNDTGIAQHQASRTDGEYWQIIQQLPHSNSYQILLMIHQQLCFGQAEVSRQDFEQCQQAYQKIEIP